MGLLYSILIIRNGNDLGFYLRCLVSFRIHRDKLKQIAHVASDWAVLLDEVVISQTAIVNGNIVANSSCSNNDNSNKAAVIVTPMVLVEAAAATVAVVADPLSGAVYFP